MARTQISTNVSERTRQQVDRLADSLGYSIRDVVTVAIDRFYREEITMMGTTLRAAVDEAAQSCSRWMGGAVIVEYDDGSFDAVPQPYLIDISWCGRGHVAREVCHLTDPADILGPDWDTEGDSRLSDEHVEFMIQQLRNS